MVNFQDPLVIAKDYAVLKSFHHTIYGVFLWEFFTTLGYEFEIIRGVRPYRRTIWIYSITRLATLTAEILNLIDMNTTTPINCQAWVSSTAIFGYVGLAAASLLIALRVVAIWNKNKIVVAIAASLWVTHVAAMIQSAARLRAAWNVALPGCIVFNTDSSKLNIIVLLITDLVLLLTMLGGLLHFRRDVGGTFGIGRLLWKQGVMWLFLATAAEVPPLVLIVLNLNVPLDLMFQPPSLIALSIAATRMHRSLTDFVSVGTDPNINLSKLHWNQTPFNRVEVTVDTSSDAYQLSQTSRHDLYIGTEQPWEKPNGYEPRPPAGDPV